MKTIVIYYSLEGSTEVVAKKIAEKLNCDLLKIETVKKYKTSGFMKFVHAGKDVFFNAKPKLKPYDFDGSKYELVIFATPVWASNFVPAFKTFIDENRQSLEGKKFAVYTGFLGGGAELAAGKLASYLGIEQFESHLILIDPLKKPDEKNDSDIAEFCQGLL